MLKKEEVAEISAKILEVVLRLIEKGGNQETDLAHILSTAMASMAHDTMTHEIKELLKPFSSIITENGDMGTISILKLCTMKDKKSTDKTIEIVKEILNVTPYVKNKYANAILTILKELEPQSKQDNYANILLFNLYISLITKTEIIPIHHIKMNENLMDKLEDLVFDKIEALKKGRPVRGDASKEITSQFKFNNTNLKQLN